MAYALSIERLSFSYGRNQVLKAIDLRVSPGQFVSVVGPDGAGKTTLVKLLSGVLKPQSGQIKIFGYDTPKNFAKVKPLLGYLSQSFSLYGDLSVDENLEFFAEIHRIKNFKERREELLEFTGLKPFRRRIALKLSGGMKQKLALACTLIHEPRLIFLDEPTTGVDPVARRDFWILLSKLIQRGLTVFMTTPYLDEAERSDLVAMLYAGQVLYAEKPEKVRMLLPYQVFELMVPQLREVYELLKAKGLMLELFGDRLNLLLPKDESNLDNIEQILKTRGINEHTLTPKEASLENVFIWLIRKKAEGQADSSSASGIAPSAQVKDPCGRDLFCAIKGLVRKKKHLKE